MCRVSISKSEVSRIKELFENQIEDNIGNGFDDTRAIILDIPQDEKIGSDGDERSAIEILMSEFYDQDKKYPFFMMATQREKQCQ